MLGWELAMMLAASSIEALRSRRQHVLDNGTVYWRSTFVRTDPSESDPSPNGFLVEQQPDSVILPHFHQANQFQVFVAGHGVLAKHPVTPVTVHYANAYSPYGPIRAGADGLHYFTLRDAYDPGARFMPGARAELKAVRRRHAMSEPVVPIGSAELMRLTTVMQQTVIAPAADGLAAWVIYVPPNDTFDALPTAPTGGSRYLVVIVGMMAHEAAALPRLSCVYLSPEEAPRLRAGPGGAALLIVQFPRAQTGNQEEAHQ